MILSLNIVWVGAENDKTTLMEAFFDYCTSNNPDLQPDYKHYVRIYEYAEADGKTFFSANACWMGSDTMLCVKEFGEWVVYSSVINYPSETGMYVRIDEQIFTLEEAWEKGLVYDLTPIEHFSKYTIVTRKDLVSNFYDYYVENLPQGERIPDIAEFRMRASVEIDGVTFFSPSINGRKDKAVVRNFGDVTVYSRSRYLPYDLGLYAASADEILTLEEAYSQGWIEDVYLLSDVFSSRYYTFYKGTENRYKDAIFRELFKEYESGAMNPDVYYEEVYEYYSLQNTASLDETVPDYVLIACSGNVLLPMVTCDVFGDYILQASSIRTPFVYGYGIYVPDADDVLDLKDAYKAGIEGIENVFSEVEIGTLMGDADRDRKLTIKDATYVQKILAGFDGFKDYAIYGWNYNKDIPCSIADFNRDQTTNIKDVTAMQKRIAGITK